MAPLINFRDDRVRDEWLSGHVAPLLSQIFLDLAQFSDDIISHTPLVTCIWRSAQEDAMLNGSGIHCLWRAIDIHAETWTDPNMVAMAKYVNDKWIYNPVRPSMKVLLWEPHGTGPHGHLQVSPATILRPTDPDIQATQALPKAMQST